MSIPLAVKLDVRLTVAKPHEIASDVSKCPNRLPTSDIEPFITNFSDSTVLIG